MHPTFQRGFTPESSYEIGEIDSINLFNGNLTITLPIGLQYPVDGQLSYGLTLVYNSLLWDYSVQADDDHEFCDGDPENPNCQNLKATPTEFANAGLGWRLSLGELYKDGVWPNTGSIGKWLYVAPDGSRHLLGTTLHEHESPDDNVWYSRDNTYLRLTAKEFSDDPTPVPTKFILEEPNGITRTFDDYVYPSGARKYVLTMIADRYGNYVYITYTWDANHEFEEWKLTDSQNREQRVTWTEVAGYTVVDEVKLAAFGADTAVYQFDYASAPDGTLITETCKDEHWGDDPEEQQTELTVPFLVAVQLPDGTSYQMKDSAGLPAYYTDSVKVGPKCEIPYSGILKRLILPTGGVYEWDFGRVEYPTGSGHSGCTRTPNPQTMTAYSFTAGVIERRIKSSLSDPATWTYFRDELPVGAVESVTTTVTTPDLNETDYYFRTQACRYDTAVDDYPAWSGWDYGLPFTLNLTDADGRYRSVAYFKDEEGERTLVRSQHVLYEHDQLPPVSSARDWYDTNRRVAETSTVFEDDKNNEVPRMTASTFSGFEGLGHYRGVTRSGWGAGDRIETTNFNPGSGTYSINSSNNTYPGGFTLPGSAAPWILTTYDSTTQVQDGIAAKQEHCFDTDKGVLTRTRVLKSGATRSASDILTVFEYDSTLGNLVGESFYGGDIQNDLDDDAETAICDLTPPGSPEYKILHTHERDEEEEVEFKRTQFEGATFFTADRTIDSKTGLVSASRDVSKVETTFTYDNMGRVTGVTPAEGAHVAAIYTSAVNDVSKTGYVPALIDVEYLDESDAVLAAEAFEFDGLGRVIAEKRQMPDDNWSERLTKYTDMGWLSRISEFGIEDASSPKWTTYSLYDPFGQAHLVSRPDESTTVLDFDGKRVASQTVSIRTSTDPETPETEFTTTAYSDHLGRVTQVQEPLSITTNYDYDVGGRLEQVDVVASGVTQSRVFAHDNRGFLTSETMPEKGASGNGFVSYSRYDTMGNFGQAIDGPSDLRFEYDNAGRILRVKAAKFCGWFTVKLFSYGQANDVDNLVLGKLKSESAFNYLTDLGTLCNGSSKLLADLIFSDGFESGDRSAWYFPVSASEIRLITRTFVYEGLGGRLSGLSTDISGDVFNQTYGWSDLGQVESVGYPDLAGFTEPAGAISTLTYGFSKGFLRSVPGYATSISYHKNGALNTIQRANDVKDIHTVDPNWIPRPRRIKAEKDEQPLWDTGDYAYDGAGNITDIGSDTFTYDGLSRLVQGTAEQGAKTQSYEYDGFGNLTKIDASTISVDTSTNRLASPATYDSAGNLTFWNEDDENIYGWTPTGEMRSRTATGINRWFGYTAEGERVVSEDKLTGTETYSLRDLSGKVLRVFEKTGSIWSWEKDYVYRDGLLLATEDSSETLHFTLDHLGTPRLVTNEAGTEVAEHAYYGFGEKADSGWDTEAMKFTGHERDLEGTPDAIDDLDYMHARYYNPNLGRFLSTDPIGGTVGSSQSWNRYSYVVNNPLNLVDPTGLYQTNCGGDEACQKNAAVFEEARQANLKRKGDIRKTALAYGDPGEANGVTVVFGASEPGAAANVAAEIGFDQNAGAFSLAATVTIDPSLSGTQLEAVVGHEGSHLVDAQAFAATFTAEGKGGWDLSKNLTVQQTESNAYQITQAILATSNTPMRFRGQGGSVELGRLSIRRQIDKAIGKIITGPLYANKLQNRQFPLWNYQP